MIRSQGKILTGKMNNHSITETGLWNEAAFGLPFPVGMHPENQLMADSAGAGKETEHMAMKSRYMGYAKELQKLSRKTETTVTRTTKTSSKESVLNKLKSLKGKEFHMTIPITESTDA